MATVGTRTQMEAVCCMSEHCATRFVPPSSFPPGSLRILLRRNRRRVGFCWPLFSTGARLALLVAVSIWFGSFCCTSKTLCDGTRGDWMGFSEFSKLFNGSEPLMLFSLYGQCWSARDWPDHLRRNLLHVLRFAYVLATDRSLSSGDGLILTQADSRQEVLLHV